LKGSSARRALRLRYVALASLAFTYLFFIEYLSPLRRVHIPYDLSGFHYPLADYAFQALKQGRFPQWDPSIYCGISFAGNSQAALLYPPSWLMFAANWGRARLSFQSLEVLVVAHVWLAFLLCFVWLRGRKEWHGRKLNDLACVLGAGVFAFGGYACLQLQHLGLIGGYTWFPLGFMGIDEAFDRRSWRPLWKLVVASALCFLAGYPPTWFVFAVCMATYAVARPWRFTVILGTALSLGVSLMLAMIQLLPAWESSAFMVREARYGAGIKDPMFFLSYLFPNFFNFGINVPIHENPGMEYLYLGAPAVLGIVLLFRLRNPRVIVPPLAVGVVSLILVTNPYDMVWNVIRHSSLIAEVCRSWYFLAGLTAAAAPLAAYGLDDFLNRDARPAPGWLFWLTLASAFAWSTWELRRYLAADAGVPWGWRSMFDPAITLAVVGLALFAYRAEKGTARVILAVALVLTVGVDYKVFGTRKRFNAGWGSGQPYFSDTVFPGFDPEAYREMRAHREYRVLLDPTGPFPLELRHAGLMTPQGFDPFFTAQYRELLQDAAVQFRTNWEFDIDPANENALKLFGIRYVVTSSESAIYPRLAASDRFHRVGSAEASYRVFEYQYALPPYGFVDVSGSDSVEASALTAERRLFVVDSGRGGRFALHEQFLPGWQASVDGEIVAIERWNRAFQAVEVPAGRHTVEFRYRSTGLEIGAWISLVSLLLLGGIYVAPRRRS
jgi:membrane protein YfhO